MANKILLLISNRQEDQDFAGEVATVAGLSLTCCPDPKIGVEKIAAEEPAVILVDGETQESYLAFEAAIQ
ncbi:MAG: hypothetical protein AABZ55_14315 [Bdellovibrionota bacterium]